MVENTEDVSGKTAELLETGGKVVEVNIVDEGDVHDAAEAIEGKPDPLSTNPHNWPRSVKWRAVAFASMYTFISPMSSSMVAPALPSMAGDLGLKQTIDVEMALSIFVLAYAVGPLVLAPLSEIYGRYKVLQASLCVFVIFNAACGFAQNETQILIFRFLTGLGGSAPVALSGSIVSDCFSVSEMGAAMSYYILGVILSPAVGPILGGFATQGLSWRWLFYIVSIVAGILALVGTFLLPETYRPYLEAQARRAALSKDPTLDMGNHKQPSFGEIMRTSLVRPFILLGTQPITQVISLIMAFVYGIMYIVLSTFSALFVVKYGQSTQISSLNYISLGIGFFIGNRLSGSLIDYSSAYLQKRFNTPHKPEYRLPVCIPAAVALPIGLFIYGWTAENGAHWFWPNFGILLFCASVNITFQALTVYTVDVYRVYAASALAAVGFLRSIAGFGFPLFAAGMYERFGYGWGNSILAFVGIGLGIPAPILLYYFGEKLRAKSTFASG
ncbi:major facilitator superfamily domain-containing protein [Chytriomyces sp. MP71]|nr:major facilitator superfamily domain-containing protein [Chytriomyces sp. MP71]